MREGPHPRLRSIVTEVAADYSRCVLYNLKEMLLVAGGRPARA
jgi:hypothetical protein